MTEKRENYEVSVEVQSIVGDVDRPRSVEIFGLLSQPMPAEALKIDDSRGFPLTSIKAAFVLERLNETFGLLGYGWRYVHGPHHMESAGGKEEVLVEVALQWRICDQGDGNACPPVYWRPQGVNTEGQITARGWAFIEGQQPIWSEPIFATGGASANRKGSVPYKDACQSATTNGITKAASRLGIGLEIFKGQNDTPPPKSPKTKSQRRKPPAQTKAAAKGNDNGFLTLTGMKQAAQAEVERLTFEDGEAQAQTIQTLAHKMSALGLKMQSARLIHTLLGEGTEYSQKTVMGVYNFLLSAKQLTAENIDTLNAAAWEGFPEKPAA